MNFIVLFIKHNTFYVLYVAFFCIYAQNKLTSLHSNTAKARCKWKLDLNTKRKHYESFKTCSVFKSSLQEDLNTDLNVNTTTTFINTSHFTLCSFRAKEITLTLNKLGQMPAPESPRKHTIYTVVCNQKLCKVNQLSKLAEKQCF